MDGWKCMRKAAEILKAQFFQDDREKRGAQRSQGVDWPPWRRGWRWRWGGGTCTRRGQQPPPGPAGPPRRQPRGRLAAAAAALLTPPQLLHTHSDTVTRWRLTSDTRAHGQRLPGATSHDWHSNQTMLASVSARHSNTQVDDGAESGDLYNVVCCCEEQNNTIITSSRVDSHVSLVCEDIRAPPARERKNPEFAWLCSSSSATLL